jgi:hypothetical protein
MHAKVGYRYYAVCGYCGEYQNRISQAFVNELDGRCEKCDDPLKFKLAAEETDDEDAA